jgi:hypothetical protein
VKLKEERHFMTAAMVSGGEDREERALDTEEYPGSTRCIFRSRLVECGHK